MSSLWFDGLKYAEEVGVIKAYEELYNYSFDDSCKDFDNGIRDYISHHDRMLKNETR